MSITYQPKKKKRKRVHGFLSRQRTKGGGESSPEEGEKGDENWLFSFKEMLPKENRLLKKGDFKKVFRKGKGDNDGFLIRRGQEKKGIPERGIFFLKILENDLGVNRFGIVVSRKVSKKATLRNKIKRRIRGILKGELPKIKKGFDVIFLASPGIEKEKPADLRRKIEKTFEGTKLIKR